MGYPWWVADDDGREQWRLTVGNYFLNLAADRASSGMKQCGFIIKEDVGLSSKCKTEARIDLALDAIQA